MSGPFHNPLFMYYWANWLYRHRVPFLPSVLQGLLFLACNAVVPYKVKIGPGCELGHGGGGVVIHKDAQIGSRVMIAQQVIIGGRSKATGLPVIGSDVFIGVDAKILGSIEIGSHSVVGANAVVIHSVPPRSVASGVPARIVREGVDSRDA